MSEENKLELVVASAFRRKFRKLRRGLVKENTDKGKHCSSSFHSVCLPEYEIHVPVLRRAGSERADVHRQRRGSSIARHGRQNLQPVDICSCKNRDRWASAPSLSVTVPGIRRYSAVGDGTRPRDVLRRNLRDFQYKARSDGRFIALPTPTAVPPRKSARPRDPRLRGNRW